MVFFALLCSLFFQYYFSIKVTKIKNKRQRETRTRLKMKKSKKRYIINYRWWGMTRHESFPCSTILVSCSFLSTLETLLMFLLTFIWSLFWTKMNKNDSFYHYIIPRWCQLQYLASCWRWWLFLSILCVAAIDYHNSYIISALNSPSRTNYISCGYTLCLILSWMSKWGLSKQGWG